MPEEIDPHLKITVAAALGTLADYATTQVGLKYPELQETNPNVNFVNEFVFANGGGEIIYALGRLFKQSKDLSLAMGLVPASWGFLAAANNLTWIALAHAKQYPWEECPMLYPE